MQAIAIPDEAETAVSNDLGPLAWVLEELKKSLDGATKAMRRFVRDAELARGSDLASLDASQLRIARQQLHQAVGALEMVGFSAPAKVLRAMEALAQKFVQRPELCSDDAANKMEKASFALAEYLEGVLKGKASTPVALFVQYRDVLEMVDGERIHPADLWPLDWQWIDAAIPVDVVPLAYEPAVRSQLDQAVLRLVKVGDTDSAAQLSRLSLGLAKAQTQLPARVFWKICAGFFEASSLGLCPSDVYLKRGASRVLLQYATLAKGDPSVSDRLAQDLLFFCAQAVPAAPASAPVLTAVRQAYKLVQTEPFNYGVAQFGRFDPAVLVQVRKRIATATETWSALAGGDTNRLKAVHDQFAMVCESILKMHPESGELARAMTHAIEGTVKSGEPPTTPVAMEVATAVLYLEAAYEDMDPADTQMAQRSVQLARRLEHVSNGGQSEPLESWMEDLYRRVSDRQTMGSVVDELRTNLAEIEKSLDMFFRNPQDKTPLHEVPSQLAQMRGVFSVLGLDQASTAMLRMRDIVEKLLVENVVAGPYTTASFEKLGSSLGAVGFLIDMLSYQRAMAKKVFVWDDDLGEFKPLMGRVAAPRKVAPPVAAPVLAPVLAPVVNPVVAPASAAVPMAAAVAVAALAPLVSTPPTTVVPAELAAAASPAPASADAETPAPATEPLSEDDMEIREIFLEEAFEVVQTGQAAVAALATDPANLAEQTTLRRAFHTLKGSSRMVGLNEFGEAAWSMEQLLNAWLAEQKPTSAGLIGLAGNALTGFGAWVGHIAARTDANWSAASFRQAADALRLEGAVVALHYPGAKAPASPVVAMEAPDVEPVSEAEMTAFMESVAPSIQPSVQTSQFPSFDSTVIPQQGPDTELQPDFQSTEMFGPEESKPKDSAAKTARVSDFSPLGLDSISFDNPVQPEFAPTGFLDSKPAFVPSEQAPVSLLPHEPDSTPAATPAPAEPVPAESELSEWDFVLEEIPPESAPDPAAVQPVAAAPSTPKDVAVSPVPAVALAPPHPPLVSEESVKVIGHLRIGIPLYNVYLNEADEWSRRLQIELSEWAMELHEQLPDSAVALAHSLSGSSATVGFQALSDIAKLLEHGMDHVHRNGPGRPLHAQIFSGAAEEIRRLLHQFAAGFLKAPDPQVLESLHSVPSLEFAPSAPSLLGDLDFVGVLEAPAEAADTQPEFAASTPALPSQPEPVAVPSVAAKAPEPAAAAVAPITLPTAAALVIAPAPMVLGDADDDIDKVDALDADLFPIFEEEAQELMPQLGGALRQWTARPDNMGARGEALRVLHTLKGSARLAGALRLGEMTHRLESVIEQLGVENLSAAQLDPLLTRFDDIQSNFAALRSGPEQAFALPEGATAGLPGPAAGASTKLPTDVLAGKAMAEASVQRLAAATTALAPIRQVANQSVRVRSNLLDRLVNQAGEVMITRSRLESRLGQLRTSMLDLSGNLERMRHHLRDIEVQAESQMQSRMALAKETSQQFDPLEFDQFTRLQELTRMMAESVNDVATIQRNMQGSVDGTEDDLISQGRQARELQRDLLRTRMVEFEGISDRLYGVVRQAAKETGKQVKLDITGGSLDVDRGVLERMAPAFEHLLRNSVAHGIESPEARIKAGKPAVGAITIDLQHQSNELSVTFSDDGGGLDLARIRDKAVSSGVAPDAHSLSGADAANLIFLPGFSTAANVTEISGRGIGMDVVRSEMNALGGRIETTTLPGKGTQFKLVLPLTTAVTQVVMLRMGEVNMGVAANVIEVVRRVPAAEVKAAYASGSFTHAGEQLAFFWGGALLQASSQSQEMITKNLPVVIFRSAGQRIAVHVDEILGNQEVVVKNLGPQLSRLPGLTGMSVLASGAVVLIYNPVALVTVYGERAKALRLAALPSGAVDSTGQAAGAAATQKPGDVLPGLMDSAIKAPLVMVVDDSITVRRVTQRLLKREGYRVVMAADGLQALERLQDERPAVVLSDIEMPRMDGFDLARNIRADAALKDMPIIMITSRIAEKHREHARELGVDHYLGKPYSEDELLRLVKNYCDAVVET